MKSSQSRLLDTQYILEYQPSPALVGQDTLCKPLQTQDGYCDSLFGQGGLSKPTVWAVAAESAVSQPIHAPRRQLQAHDVTPALQLTVEGVLLRTPLAPSGRATVHMSGCQTVSQQQTQLISITYSNLEGLKANRVMNMQSASSPNQLLFGRVAIQYQPGICNQPAADRSERKRTIGSIGLNSNGSQKRGRWRNKNYKRGGVLDLWSNAGLPLHAMREKTS
ncbi:hypothetical protein WJX77_002859 [Trebouxia sp. C0004]